MKTLWLTPTDFERRMLVAAGMPKPLVCGFGLAAAGAVAATLIARHRPEAVGLIGIAGSLRPAAVVGEAFEFDVIRCDGIGVGEAGGFLTAGQMGWPHVDGEHPIGDQIDLRQTDNEPLRGCLLSVAAASASRQQAERRATRFDNDHCEVIAEDMEAFSVAVACRIAGVPLRVIRGISNQAGERDKSNWRLDAALAAAVTLAG